MNPKSVDYHKKAGIWVKSFPGDYVMVRGKATGDDRRDQRKVLVEWFTYFLEKGMHDTIRVYQMILKQGGNVMFPCAVPDAFDKDYRVPGYTWIDDEKPEAPISRGNVRNVIDKTLESLRGATTYGARRMPHMAPERPQSPQEWLRAYQEAPPPMPGLSPRLRANLGLPQERPEDGFEGLDPGGERG